MQPKCAHAELVLALGDIVRSHKLVLLPDPELIAGNGRVKLGEEAQAPGLIDKLVDVRKGLDGALRDGIQLGEILAMSRPRFAGLR